MTNPANAIFQNGLAVISGDQLNTFAQTDQTAAQLRNFVGQTPMAVFLQGISAPNDGHAGMFVWVSGTGFIDDNLNTIVPSSSTGAWIRTNLGGSGTISTGTTSQLGYYAANGTTISGLTLGSGLSISSGILNVTAGGGNVSNYGTPTSGQIAQWTSSNTIQGVGTSGTGGVVLVNSPTLVTPALGTPSAINLTNATANSLPVTAISATGTASNTTVLYGNGSWGSVSNGTVTSVASGTGLTGGPITGSGTLSIANTAVTTGTYGNASAVGTFTVNQQGQLTSASSTAISIPASAINSAIANSQLANSSVTFNGTTVALGGSGMITATATNALTLGTGLSGTSYNGSTAVTAAIANTGVSTGTYGNSTYVPVITINAQGQITNASSVAVSGGGGGTGTVNSGTTGQVAYYASNGTAVSGEALGLLSVTATGSTTARTLATRSADRINVLDWGLDPTGTSDNTTLFQSMVTATQSQGAGVYWFPSVASGHTYKFLSVGYVPDGFSVLMDGAVQLTGGGNLNTISDGSVLSNGEANESWSSVSSRDSNVWATYNSFVNATDIAYGTSCSISGTVLTVGGTITGTFAVGQQVFTATSSGSVVTTQYGYITSLGTGTGGAGTYNLSASASVSSTTIYAAAGYEKAAGYDATTNYANSSYTTGTSLDTGVATKDVVGRQMSTTLVTPSYGRGWGSVSAVSAASGYDGLMIGSEIDITSSTSQGEHNRHNSKTGVMAVSQGAGQPTTGFLVTATNAEWYDGYTALKGTVSRNAFVLRDLSVYPSVTPFYVDASGNVSGQSYILQGSTSGTITQQASGTTSNYSVIWPSNVGTFGQCLSINSVANSTATLSWSTVSGTGTVTNVATGTGLTGGPITTTGTIALANTAVTAGTYGNASAVGTFTVNAQGQLTGASTTSIAIANTQVSGLGTMSTQNANAVAVTGGSINGTTIGGSTAAAVTATTLTANTVTATDTAIGSSANTGAINYGALPFNDTGNIVALNYSANSYGQIQVINPNGGSLASSDIVVGNGNTTSSTYFGNLGMNSPAYGGQGFSANNVVYLTSTSAPLWIGSTTAHPVNFTANSATSPAISISSANLTTIGSLGLSLTGSSSGTTGLVANASAGSWTMTLPPNAGTLGYVLQTDGSGNTSWATGGSGSSVNQSLFGNGLDGNVTISGTVTLSKDMNYNNLTISGSNKINTNGFIIRVLGTLDISGAGANAIYLAIANGSNASGATSGARVDAIYGYFTNNTLPMGSYGGAGGTGTTGTGNAGISGNYNNTSLIGGGTTGIGYGYGGGGSISGGTGGNGGKTGGNFGTLYYSVSVSNLGYSVPVTPALVLIGNPGGNYGLVFYLYNGTGAGAGGGGSGAGDSSTNTGGGGGGGAPSSGMIAIYANVIARGTNTTAGIIAAKGGTGGNGGNSSGGVSGGGGGGGGGCGGAIWIAYNSVTGSAITNALDVSGGNGGTGGNGSSTGTGGAGGVGGASGYLAIWNLSSSPLVTVYTGAAGASGGAASGTTGGSGGTGKAYQANL